VGALQTELARREGTVVVKKIYAGKTQSQALLVSLVLSCSGVVLAQSPAEQSDATQSDAAPSAQATPVAAGAPLQEVVVTATRREENQMTVPISLSAVTVGQIDTLGLRTLEDITRLAPGIQFNEGNGKIVIRGINGNSIGAGPVGIYIDDTPIQVRTFGTATANAVQHLFDISRVEILRGPQGTLFGAGSEGGTVRYILGQPNTDIWNSYGRAELNDMQYGTMGGEAGVAIGGPIVQDEIGFRFSAWDSRTPGYVDRVSTAPPYNTLDANANWTNTSLFRAALTFKPMANLTITPSMLYQGAYTNNTGSSFVVALSDPSEGVFKNESPTKEFNWDQFYLPALRVDYNAGFADLIYNGSYFNRGQYGNNDYTTFFAGLFGIASPTGPEFGTFPNYDAHTDAVNRQSNVTQELRLQSANPEARISWTAGLFYAHLTQNNREHTHDPEYYQFFSQVIGLPGGFGPLIPGTDFSYYGTANSLDVQGALFAQLDFHITHGLTFTLGERFSRFLLNYQIAYNGPYNGGPTGGYGSANENVVTPLYTLQWQANPNNMFYGTVSKGFRPGGVADPYPADLCAASLAALGYTGTPPGAFKPDYVWNYEVGAKNTLAGGRVQMSTSIYRIDWYQIQTALGLPSCGFTLDTNVGTARSEGFDYQANFAVLPKLTLGLTVGRTNAFYSESVYGAPRHGVRPLLTANGDTIGGPPWTVGATIDWRFPLFSHDGYFSGYYSYFEKNSGTTPGQDPATGSYNPQSVYPDPPTSRYASARLGMFIKDFDVSLFVNNLTNDQTLLSYSAAVGTPFYEATVSPPRIFGVTLIYHH
jgi:outer membrane receptor protein involved in Fe transport